MNDCRGELGDKGHEDAKGREYAVESSEKSVLLPGTDQRAPSRGKTATNRKSD